MSNFKFRNTLLVIMLTMMSTVVFGQTSSKSGGSEFENHWFINFDAGASVLYGDNKTHQFDMPGFNANLGGGYAFAKHFSVYGRIGGATLDGELENFFTVDKASVLSGDLNFSVDVISLICGRDKDCKFGLLLHGGVGHLHYKSKASIADGTVLQWGYDEENGNKGNGIGGRRIIFSTPVGGMVNYQISKRWDVYADFTATYGDTERLDGVSSGDHKDWYLTANVGVRYKFKKNENQQPGTGDGSAQEPQEPAQEAAQPAQEAVQEPAQEIAVRQEIRSDFDIVFNFMKYDTIIHETTNIASTIEKINNLEGARIENITIIGYSSPEGSKDFNLDIAGKRAENAKKYLAGIFGENVNDAQFDITAVGADWDSYISALRKSNVKDKNYIITKLLDSKSPTNTLWMLLANYPEIADMFTDLRRAEVTITVIHY